MMARTSTLRVDLRNQRLDVGELFTLNNEKWWPIVKLRTVQWTSASFSAASVGPKSS
jgi:hypothetical protein